LSLESSDHPLILAPEEGVVVISGGMGEQGRAFAYFNLDYCVVASTNFKPS
jgi:hypothetical protein